MDGWPSGRSREDRFNWTSSSWSLSGRKTLKICTISSKLMEISRESKTWPFVLAKNLIVKKNIAFATSEGESVGNTVVARSARIRNNCLISMTKRRRSGGKGMQFISLMSNKREWLILTYKNSSNNS